VCVCVCAHLCGPRRRNIRTNYEDPNYNVGLPVFAIHGAGATACLGHSQQGLLHP
jgi:hypothetical protein